MRRIAYAKINLMLKVLSKLDSGFHELQMVNAKIDLFDIITIEKNLTGEINICFDTDLLDSKKDPLIYDIVLELKNKYQIQEGFDIYIEKNIPIGAGLAGGSTDAATVIEMILDIMNIEVSLEGKILFAKQFGSDISYCFYDCPCIVMGLGEKIIPISIAKESELILITPDIFVSTKEIFEANTAYSIPLEINVLESVAKNDLSQIMVNDLERSTFLKYPHLAILKNKLQGYGNCVMSGSGPSLIFRPETNLDIYLDILKRKYPNYKIIKIKIKE